MRIVWAAYLVTILVAFVTLETFAMATQRSTLTDCIRELSTAWPMVPVFIGVVIGAVLSHLWGG